MSNPKDPLQKGTYHSYIEDEVAMQEYHVDMHKRLVEFVSLEPLKYGGNLSVWKSPTPQALVFIGHNESSFHFPEETVSWSRGHSPNITKVGRGGGVHRQVDSGHSRSLVWTYL